MHHAEAGDLVVLRHCVRNLDRPAIEEPHRWLEQRAVAPIQLFQMPRVGAAVAFSVGNLVGMTVDRYAQSGCAAAVVGVSAAVAIPLVIARMPAS
jgi:hypothetical protein